jgi:hypothetical protein
MDRDGTSVSEIRAGLWGRASRTTAHGSLWEMAVLQIWTYTRTVLSLDVNIQPCGQPAGRQGAASKSQAGE